MLRFVFTLFCLASLLSAFGSGAANAQSGGADGPVCRTTETALALDFWLGEWVVMAAGQKAGDNVIEFWKLTPTGAPILTLQH